MRATTVKAVKRLAKKEGISLQELGERYEMIALSGNWEADDNEVLVPNNMPVEGQRVPIGHVIK